MTHDPSPVTGWRCAVCGAEVPIAQPLQWRCPQAGDGGHHVLRIVQHLAPLRSTGEVNPFVGFRRYLAWDAFAAAHGLDADARTSIAVDLDRRIASVAGTGFVTTPFARSTAMSDELGFSADGGVWVKDETNQVAGSHKARHLMSIALHLVTAERLRLVPWTAPSGRPPLAIASCGNAAFAASTLAAALDWPIRVFVPPGANPVVLQRLHELRADVVECPRMPGDPPGDPCVLRFRDAVADGAVPFSVQGTENAWCLDGGRTIGWEMARHMEEREVGPPLDRLFVQVGGGAFAACVAAGFAMSGVTPRLHAVQTAACAPLERAWQRCAQTGGVVGLAGRWGDCMWPWEQVGTSAADGILDDETYDWLPVVEAMANGGGRPIVVDEALVAAANQLVRRGAGLDASHTGTAGVAGLLAARDEIGDDERVAVIVSGVERRAAVALRP
ncbi:MAG: PLP-dependent lyase/thiolase [Ilumatobacteraceae bacterium]